MNTRDKKELFEYIITKLSQWHAEAGGVKLLFGKVKLQKLLFFLCTTEHKLLDRFNRFYALPNGPVESSILTAMDKDQFKRFDFSGDTMSERTVEFSDFSVSNENRELVDSAIENLKKRNNSLVLLSGYHLADISHEWQCWKKPFGLAGKMGYKAYPIDPLDIKRDKSHTYV